MIPTLARATLVRSAARAPAAMPPMRSQMMQKRYATLDNRGGKSKLIFRIGMKDVPVELYPMAFVVGAGLVGAAFAIGRHFYLDGLRLGPKGHKNEE